MLNKIILGFKKTIFNTYFDDRILSNSDLERSRNISVIEGCTSRTVVTLTGGAFLAGFIKYLGADDRLNGIIAAIPTLSGIAMLLSPMLFERIARRKFLITFGALISRLLLSLMIFIPLMKTNSRFNIFFLIATFALANLTVSFITPSASNWIISITPQHIRGKYFGMRESYVLGFVALATLFMGNVLDYFKKAGLEHTGFMALFIMVFVLTLINYYFASKIEEPKMAISDKSINSFDVFTLPLKDKKFRRIILLLILWNIGFQISAPFTAVYMVSILKLNYTYITLTGLLAAAASVISARYFGRFADNKSWFFLMGICVGFQAASQLIWFVLNSNNAVFLIPLSQLLAGAAIGGVNISLSNIQYRYSPNERKTLYMGFSSAIGGLFGFLSSIVGSIIIGVFSRYNLSFLGYHTGYMQIVFGLSGIILIGCTVFISSLRLSYK